MKVNIPKVKNTDTKDTDFIKSPVKLTISLLVSNQIGTIRKCMESLKPILDAVPSELIVVDTVGTENSDGSLDIAREYADQVVRFEWCDDFAAARNAGLSRAKGEWFLYVDDDEWFEDPTEIIEFFTSGEYKNYGCTQYAVRSYDDESMTSYSDGWVTRLARRTPAMKFVHPIHEMLRPIYNPEKKFTSCYAHHVGYIFKNKEEKAKHFQRNVVPLLEELEEQPNNLRLIMQLIQEYQFNNEFEKAEEYCRRGEVANDDPNYDTTWNWIATALVRCLISQEKWDEAKKEARRLLEHPRLNDLARVNIYYLMGSAAENQNDYETMLDCSKKYYQLARYFDDHQDKLMEQVMLAQTDILMPSRRESVHRAMFLSCKYLERFEEICDFADSISWDQEYMRDKLYCFLTLEAVDKTGNFGCLTRMLTKLLANGGISDELMKALRQVCDSPDLEKRYQFRKAMVRTGSTEPYFLVLKAWSAEQDGEDVQEALQECLEQGVDCAFPHEDLLLICLRGGYDPSPFLEPLYLEDWVACFHKLVSKTPLEGLPELLALGEQGLQPVDAQQFFFLAKLICQRMMEDPELPADQLWEKAMEYVGYTMEYSGDLYREEIMQPDRWNHLPREVIFAFYLQEAAGAWDEKDWKRAFDALKECVRAYPPKKEFVNRLIDQIDKEMEAEQDQLSEFAEMATKIKQSVHQMIGAGQVLEARGILDQLKALMPQDPEIQELEKKVSMSERLNDLTTLMH